MVDKFVGVCLRSLIGMVAEFALVDNFGLVGLDMNLIGLLGQDCPL